MKNLFAIIVSAAALVAMPAQAQQATQPEGHMIGLSDGGGINECGVSAVSVSSDSEDGNVILVTAGHCVEQFENSRERYLQVRFDGLEDPIFPTRAIIDEDTDVAFLEIEVRDQRMFRDIAYKLPTGGEEIGELIRSINPNTPISMAVPVGMQQNDTLSDFNGTRTVSCDSVGTSFTEVETIVISCGLNLVRGQSGSGVVTNGTLWAVVSRDTSGQSDALGGNVGVAWLSVAKFEDASSENTIRINRRRDLAMVGL